MNDHRILDLSEAAAFLHASEDAVTAYVRSGELPAGKVGKTLIFLQRHLLEFADANIAAHTASRRESNPALSAKPNWYTCARADERQVRLNATL